MKRRILLLSIISLCLLSIACSENGKSILSGEDDMGKEVVSERKIELDKESTYHMGETLEAEGINTSLKKGIVYKYALNKAEMFQNPREAGIAKKELTRSEINFPNECEMLEVDDAMEKKVILCDLTLTNIASDLLHIGVFTIAYENSEHELESIGDPIYFSHHKTEPGDGTEYYHFILMPGETMECQIAWSVDAALENHQLYFCYELNSDKCFRQFIPLEL